MRGAPEWVMSKPHKHTPGMTMNQPPKKPEPTATAKKEKPPAPTPTPVPAHADKPRNPSKPA